MGIHLVQISDGQNRCVALVEEPDLLCLQGVTCVYEMVLYCLKSSQSLADYARSHATGQRLAYDEVYSRTSTWRLLSPIDVPNTPSRVLVAGTGLTHMGSARQRQAMHLADAPKTEAAVITDSMRMFQWGVEKGRPDEGAIGIAPEWFYKGDGSVLRAPFETLEIPEYAEDGGDEAELAGIYVVAEDGTPYRIGMAQGNEFSDHTFEKRNYLNLAGSKLRHCSLGPELVIDADFLDVRGKVKIERDGATLWEKKIASGEENMCHSLANLEHHHFKFAGHRQPGNVHVHYYGADALSFGDGVVLRDGDVTEVSFEGYGRPLRNSIHEAVKSTQAILVQSLG